MLFLGAIVAPAYELEPARSLRGSGVLGLAIFVSGEISLYAIARTRFVVSVDEHRLNMTVVTIRWPLEPLHHELRVAEVRELVIQKAPRGTTMRLALELHGGCTLPLTRSYFGDLGQIERDATAIRALAGLGVPTRIRCGSSPLARPSPERAASTS